MTNKTIEIAFAAFLHDIGKFIQKIAEDSGEKITEDFKLRYLPVRDGRYGYPHAAYTAFFILKYLKNIPGIKDIQEFTDLAAKHHLPDSKNIKKEELYIQYADRLSAGMEREKSEDSINYRDFTKTRLISIFDELDNTIKKYEDRRYQYDLAPFNADSIFPIEKEDSSADYTTISKGFERDLAGIKANTLEDYFNQFDTICEKWTTFIPSASAGETLPDISLYDHSKTTSAIAQALYLYHQEYGDYKIDIKDGGTESKTEKFLYFKAKFNGIQNFIFSEGGETNKKAAKILRGRSFYISFLMNRIANLICDRLELAHTAIIMNAAGTITAVLPNTEKTKNILLKTEEQINNWLIKYFYGEVSVSFAYIPASGNDLTFKNNTHNGLDYKMAEELKEKKFTWLPLDKFGVVNDYFNEGQYPCPFCGKRPANERTSEKIGEVNSCDICEDLIKIGEQLSRKERKPYLLKVPLFGEENNPIYKTVQIKDYDNLYVPLTDDGRNVKDFDTLTKNESEQGIEALGVLKADIDNLGSLFSRISKKGGLSRRVTLSRMLDAFWTQWLPNELEKNKKFSNIYTVFSGGDDLFLIGKWDTVIDFALHLKDKFKAYTCNSSEISFSAGIAILASKMPISKFYELSEYALEKSKNYEIDDRAKNALTLFNETIPWERKDDLQTTYNDLESLIRSKKINSAALTKIMEFINMANAEDRILTKKGKYSQEELQSFKWRALLTYFIARNDKFKGNEDKRERIMHFIKDIEQQNSRSILKTMLWRNIYENRTRRS